MEYDSKAILGLLAAAVAVVNYAPYLVGLYRHNLQPHAFSFIIWTVMTAVTFFAQMSDNAGPGAWATGATSVTLFFIAIFAARNRNYTITRSDKLSFFGALAAIPAWILTADPLYAVIIVTIIEAFGFYPTLRKAYQHPYDDSVLAFTLTIIKYILALAALRNYSLTTTLFPLALIILSTTLLSVLFVRRRKLSRIPRR